MYGATRRSSLAVATTALGLVALSFFAWVLIKSLQPTDATLDAHVLEVNLTELQPGEVLRIDWGGTEVLVLRRTTEQIDWLKSFVGPTLRPHLYEEPFSPMLGNKLRSLQEKYFVAAIWKNGKHFTLRENSRQSYWCDDFRYSSDKLYVSGNMTFAGGFYCASMYRDQFAAPNLQETPFVYDAAGRSSSEWIMPLEIPRHEFQGEKLVLGKRS